MHARLTSCLLLCVPVASTAQEIVKVPASKAPTVARPDDLFKLPPGQWHFAKRLWEGSGPCDASACEAGFNGGDLVVSVEKAGEYVRIIAGFRGCEAVGYSEVEVGTKPGSPTFGRVRDQVKRVVKGVAKTCKLTAPDVPKIEAAQLFPARQG